MIKDRLKELKAISHCSNNVETVVVFRDDTAQDINIFLREVEAIHDLLVNIKVNTNEIRKLHNIIISMPGAHELKSNEVNERQTIVHNTIRNVKSKLNDLEISVQRTQNSSAVLRRIQGIQMNSLHEIFTRLIEDYNNALISHRERCAAIMKRQAKISNRDAELDELLEKDSAIFIDNIIADTLDAQFTLNALKSRHNDLQKIESTLQEIQDMFTELAIHVQVQGEKMNCIRYLVEKSGGLTEHGISKLEKAKRKARRRRKRCRKIKLTLAVVGIILGLIILILLF